MTWNDAALRLLRLPPEAGVLDGLANGQLGPGIVLPGAVDEWFRAGADRRLAALSDNRINGLTLLGHPAHARYLDAGLLLLETDSQHCCRWVTVLDGGEDPAVYLIDPGDSRGGSRSLYAETFSAYTQAKVWDALLFVDEHTEWSFDHELAPDAVRRLGELLTRLPTTFGWAHNQTCDVVHRFDGQLRVALAVSGNTALWTVSATTDMQLRATVAEILGVPQDGRRP